MIRSNPASDSSCYDDDAFARLMEEITQVIEAGEAVDLSKYEKEYPEYSERLRRLLPALKALDDLGLSAVRSSLGGSQKTSPPSIDGTLGDFRIVREIGRGGMGVVYEAEQISLKRRVALKVLPFATVMGSQHLARFQNEAQAAASLKHPNIVQVYAVGCERGVHHYAMEYVEGQTLEAVVDELRQASGLAPGRKGEPPSTVSRLTRALCEGTLAKVPRPSADQPTQVYRPSHPNPHASPTEDTHAKANAHSSTDVSHQGREYFRSVARLGLQAAQALEHAHQMGVVHRDIKPSNLMVDASGHLWVTDFGLAMTQTEGNLTMTGDVLGTLRYMSPEQAEGDRRVLDHRTDVYSLGVTLYELLALRPPFDARDRHQLIHQIIDGEPPRPRQFNRAIPPDLETIVLKAISAEPKERYATARLLADDLENFLDYRPIRARRPTLAERSSKWARRHRAVVWAAVATLLIAVGALATSTVMISGALGREKTQRGIAESQHQRAIANLNLALDALDEVYIKAIGEQRLLRQPEMFAEETAPAIRPEFSEFETELLQRGLGFYDQFARQNRDNPDALLTTGKAFYRVALLQSGLGEEEEAKKAYTEAIARFKRLTEEHPDNGTYFLELGKAYRALGLQSRWWPDEIATFEKAKEALTRAIELEPDSPEAFHLRAHVHGKLTEYAEEISDFEAAIRLAPRDPELHMDFAKLLSSVQDLKLRDYHRALEHAKEAFKLAPHNHEYGSFVAALYRFTLHDYESAIKTWEEMLKFSSTPQEEHQARATIAALRGDYEAVVENFSQVLAMEEKAWTYYQRAGSYRKLGATTKALDDLTKAEERVVQEVKQEGGVFKGLPLICQQIASQYDELGAFDKAIACLDRFTQLRPNTPGLYETRMDLYSKRGLYEKALADANKAVELVPKRSVLRKRRAVIFFRLGRYDEALADLNKGIELNPKDLSTLTWIKPKVVAKCPDETFRAGVMELADRAIELTDRSPRAFAIRGWHHAALGQTDESLADLETASRRISKVENSGELDLRPTCLEMELCCRELGPRKKILPYLQKLIELQPENWNLPQFYDDALWTIVDNSRPDEANAIVQDLIDKTPDTPEGRFKRAKLLAMVERHDEAFAICRELDEQTPNDSKYLVALATVYFQHGDKPYHEGDLEKAFPDIDRAIRCNPEYSEALDHRAHIYQARGDFESALDDYDRSIASGAAYGAYTYQGLGGIYADQGKLAETVACYSKAVELNGDAAVLRYLLASAHLAAGDLRAYRTTRAQMLEKYQDSKDASNGQWTAWTYLLTPDAMEDYVPVIQLAERAVEADEKSISYLTTLGGILFRAGRHEEAVKRLTETSDLVQDPDNNSKSSPAYTWDLLAMSHHKLGHDEEAKSWLQKANEWTDKALAEDEAGTSTLPWNRRLTLKLFREEAEGMIEAGKVDPASQEDEPSSENSSEPTETEPAAETAVEGETS